MNSIASPLNFTPSRIDLALRKALLDKLALLQNAELTIVDPLGEIVLGKKVEDGLSSRIQISDLRFYRQTALGGSIGAAESYMDLQWQADDLTKVVQILVRNRDLLDSMEGGLATIANQLLKVWHFANRNSQAGSKKNIAAHYDLGNDFFKLFLDQHGMYSSATFLHSEMSLEQASTAKLERICQKLQLNKNDHVIEIGTGWGGFAVYAAKYYGCKITTTTISKEQYQAAQHRFELEGVADQITLLREDYRDLQGKYDKLVSIEMIEAVGHQYLDTYSQQCAALLKPDGLGLIQAITIEDRHYRQALKSVDFIKRYIFPGSFIPCVSAIVASMSCTDLRLINLEDQGESYAITLNAWRTRFMAGLEQVRAQGYNEEFIRMWEFYLSYCEGGFKEKSISNVQLLLAKPGNRREQWLADNAA
ncbi:cyclopropane-fatty-acyl-phospholipid synthase family protein [Methyloglobulus sp.]|uniref:cyclopropane-fatty-acyl-phospholipid synthase family protein n=1 Tax=Methyloglobulus sp. TaxID=2518622 RepID=UPI0032B80DC7